MEREKSVIYSEALKSLVFFCCTGFELEDLGFTIPFLAKRGTVNASDQIFVFTYLEIQVYKDIENPYV